MTKIENFSPWAKTDVIDGATIEVENFATDTANNTATVISPWKGQHVKPPLPEITLETTSLEQTRALLFPDRTSETDLLRYLNAVRGEVWLDVDCGGRYLHHSTLINRAAELNPRLSVLGVDPRYKSETRGMPEDFFGDIFQRENRLRNGTVNNLPLDNESTDLIMLQNGRIQLSSKNEAHEAALFECYRVLKPNGQIRVRGLPNEKDFNQLLETLFTIKLNNADWFLLQKNQLEPETEKAVLNGLAEWKGEFLTAQ